MTKAYYIYLHGFASSPLSTKAQYLSQYLARLNLGLNILDLNQNDFYNLTLSRQIEQVKCALPTLHIPVTIIGSSFGGLTAAWSGQKYSQVNRLILLAPAFDFYDHLLLGLGETKIQQWQRDKYLLFYHYGKNQELPLDYQFITDLMQYNETPLTQPVSTLIIHGKQDEVIPIQSSRNYAQDKPWVNLVEVDSDHGLTNVLPEIGQLIEQFLAIDLAQ